MIHNLLSVTRLESSTVELRRTPESIEDIVHSALGRFQQRAGQKGIVADLAEDLPLISAEPLLLEQVLVNLLENATRYAGVRVYIKVLRSKIEKNPARPTRIVTTLGVGYRLVTSDSQ